MNQANNSMAPNNNNFQIIHPTAKCELCAVNVNITHCARCKRDNNQMIYFCEPCYAKHASLDHDTISIIDDPDIKKQKAIQTVIKPSIFQRIKSSPNKFLCIASFLCVAQSFFWKNYYGNNNNRCWLI